MVPRYFSDNYPYNESSGPSFPSLKLNDDLYDDDQNVVQKVLSVRRVSLPHDGEDWEIVENNRVVHVVKGIRLTKRERSVLRSVDGIRALMDQYKMGNKSYAKIKKMLKELWKKNND